MAGIHNWAALFARIFAGYIVASFIASLVMFILGSAITLFDQRIEGMTLGQELSNQLGFVPIFAAFAAVLAAPVALIAIAISEFAKIDRLWFFLIMGSLAAIPALFRGDYMTPTRMAEDFVTLGPIGAIAGTAYWLVRHRKWPV